MTVFYNKTKELAKRLLLRRSQTPEEAVLWGKVRNNQLGFKIKRQYSVGPYVLDFYCPSRKLAIEIDGSQHTKEKEYDKERSKCLSVFGIKVIRFWNNEINANMDKVISKIISELENPLLDKGRQGEVRVCVSPLLYKERGQGVR
jgi:very-short-patch-repair endonuclease